MSKISLLTSMRHKDFVGNILSIGDRVVYVERSAYRSRALSTGFVLGFAPKTVRIGQTPESKYWVNIIPCNVVLFERDAQGVQDEQRNNEPLGQGNLRINLD